MQVFIRLTFLLPNEQCQLNSQAPKETSEKLKQAVPDLSTYPCGRGMSNAGT